ncbi:MAG: carotenoid 1,2-hydratase [Proteobacteria bacterium]|nr:carotenoid 1,2-hydratase [Pseudomonadota bacterium]
MHFFWCLAALLPATSRSATPDEAAPAVPGYVIAFPRDHGSHPGFRTEWWYVTGWLQGAHGPRGFQITFFRSRTDPELTGSNPSHFTPRQLIIAHAALSDPRLARLRQEQRVARAGLGLAGAMEGETDVWIDAWKLWREAGRFHASMQGTEFSFELVLNPAQAPLLQGDAGFSRKGPSPASASYYYSLPHLAVSGTLMDSSGAEAVNGEAWLDHEWSSEYLDAKAAGWDWTGINFDDGSALMAFRIRAIDGSVRWAGGSLRLADGTVRTAAPRDVRFIPQRYWRSSKTGTVYPGEWIIQVFDRRIHLIPLFDHQENDTRATTGAIYWEGAVQARQGPLTGHGYLELTGYGQPLRLR